MFFELLQFLFLSLLLLLSLFFLPGSLLLLKLEVKKHFFLVYKKVYF